MSEATRAWLYRISIAVVPILVAYGVLESEDAAVWIGLAAAVFNSVLASANTSTKSDNP
jgi:hypothetical protein